MFGRIRAAPAVDRLVVIADDTQIFGAATMLDSRSWRGLYPGTLNEHESKPAPPTSTDLGNRAQNSRTARRSGVEVRTPRTACIS